MLWAPGGRPSPPASSRRPLQEAPPSSGPKYPSCAHGPGEPPRAKEEELGCLRRGPVQSRLRARAPHSPGRAWGRPRAAAGGRAGSCALSLGEALGGSRGPARACSTCVEQRGEGGKASGRQTADCDIQVRIDADGARAEAVLGCSCDWTPARIPYQALPAVPSLCPGSPWAPDLSAGQRWSGKPSACFPGISSTGHPALGPGALQLSTHREPCRETGCGLQGSPSPDGPRPRGGGDRRARPPP